MSLYDAPVFIFKIGTLVALDLKAGCRMLLKIQVTELNATYGTQKVSIWWDTLRRVGLRDIIFCFQTRPQLSKDFVVTTGVTAPSDRCFASKPFHSKSLCGDSCSDNHNQKNLRIKQTRGKVL
jgi:hypothetical protein